MEIFTAFAKWSHVSLDATLVLMVRREFSTTLMRNLADRDRVIGLLVMPQACDLDQQIMYDLRREMRIVSSVIGPETNATFRNQRFNRSHIVIVSRPFVK